MSDDTIDKACELARFTIDKCGADADKPVFISPATTDTHGRGEG